MKQALRDGDSCNKVVQFSLELWLPFIKLYFHAAQGLKPQQEQISVKLWIWKVTFLMEHLMVAQCLQALLLKPCYKMTWMIITEMNYPGNLDDKSPESTPPSMRPPSQSASPPPWYLKQAGLPHSSEVRCDMNRISCLRDQVVRGTLPDVQETCMVKLIPSQRLRGTSCMISIGKR